MKSLSLRIANPTSILNKSLHFYYFLSNIRMMNLFSMNPAWKQTSWFLRNSKMVRMNFRLRPSNTEYTEVCRLFILHSAYTYFTTCYFVYKISSIGIIPMLDQGCTKYIYICIYMVDFWHRKFRIWKLPCRRAIVTWVKCDRWVARRSMIQLCFEKYLFSQKI